MVKPVEGNGRKSVVVDKGEEGEVRETFAEEVMGKSLEMQM